MSGNGSKRRVAVTGLGVISPLGNSREKFWDALLNGRSGVAALETLPALEGRVVFGGECREFRDQIDDFGELDKELKKAIRKALKMMCRESMMAVAAAQQAIADAGLGAGGLDPDRSGVVFGSDYMLSPPEDLLAGMVKCGAGRGEFDFSKWGSEGLKEMNPLWMLNYLPNMPASHIAIFNDLRGPNNSLTMREASGLMAIREAVQTIERGHADRMIAGATGTRIHSTKTVHAWQQEKTADPSLAPEAASAPFDKNRTGMVVGEGAGAVMLEELESARARDATIYGEIAGTGSSAIEVRPSDKRMRIALANAIRVAMSEAGMGGFELGHIAAHGLATPEADVEEAAALTEALEGRTQEIPVAAPKSYFGNLGAGSGVVETIASLLAIHTGQLFQTLNFTTADPECPLNVACAANPCPPGESFLKLSVTPQGQAAAIVVRRASS